jgi:hypothetical protein
VSGLFFLSGRKPIKEEGAPKSLKLIEKDEPDEGECEGEGQKRCLEIIYLQQNVGIYLAVPLQLPQKVQCLFRDVLLVRPPLLLYLIDGVEALS